MLKNVGKVLKWIVMILLIFIIIINITLIVKTELNKDEIADFLGYTPFIVATGSMEPVLHVEDIIITKKVEENQLKKGDIISYYDKQDKIVITHRIINIEEQEGKKIYTTKGDNNSSEDRNKITIDNIQGKYVISIPFVGKIANYTATPMGLIMIVIMIILIYIIFEIISQIIQNNQSKK